MDRFADAARFLLLAFGILVGWWWVFVRPADGTTESGSPFFEIEDDEPPSPEDDARRRLSLPSSPTEQPRVH